MKTSLRFVYLSLFTIIMTSCGNKTATSAINNTAKSDSTAVQVSNKPVHNKLNDEALFLAGLPLDSTTAIPAKLRNYTFYKHYCDTMSSGFNNMEANRLSKMRAWATTELAPELASPKTVFYPFSGPDILHCVQFFPNADQYIMIALERYGSLPPIDKMDSLRTLHTLDYMQQSLEDIFGKSYFITRKMAMNVSNLYNGFAPLACVFLVRTGYSILDIKYKHLLDDGKTMQEIPMDSMSHYQNNCLEIYFQKKDGGKIQKLTYFRTNLSDSAYMAMPGLKGNKGMTAYLDSLPECYTYVKAASYMMCRHYCTIMRNVCLTKSKTILQDDTGIGFSYYNPQKWTIKLYGGYEKPIVDFQGGFYQPNLAKAYKTDSANVKPLPFSLGYHWHDQVQNLMKFEKK